MISVLHLITNLETGGAEGMLCRLAAGMDRNRFRNVVVSMMGKGAIGGILESEGIPVYTLGMKRGVPGISGVWKLARIIRSERPRIIQAWMYHANLLGLLAGRLCGVPVTMWNVRCSNMDMGHYSKLSSMVIKLSALLSSLPEAVVVNSGAGRLFHEGAGYRPKMWKVIPNGFELDRFRPDPEARRALRRELGIMEDAPVIGMVARFDPMKDHGNFLEAAAMLLHKHRNVHFVLAGARVDGNNRELADGIAGLGLGSNVHLLGERRDIAAVIAGFDIATSSSYGEGFPNTVGEAMSCRVPCVVTDAGDSSVIVGDTGRVVPVKDPQALAAAWRDLVEMGEAGRSDLGLRARLRIEQKYGLPAVVSQYEALYKEFASACAG